MHIRLKKLIQKLTAIPVFTLFAPSILLAHGFGPVPISLKDVPVPEVPGLIDGADPIIINKEKAIILGKALFWDMNVGSDGIACASCHFHAGADRRTKNQLAPIGRNSTLPQEFSARRDGTPLGPNTTLTKRDFPFIEFEDSGSHLSDIIYESKNVVSSAGTFGGDFRDNTWFNNMVDDCDRSINAVFHVGAKGTRQVEPRNTPSVINAVFNFRNFWDGRANNVFNGSSPWGDRDPDAGVWVKQADGSVTKERLQLINSSLASLAVAPPQDSLEMSCDNRPFASIGRKLLFRKPLEHQQVHWNDSVLGDLAASTEGNLQNGLNTRYYHLIRQSFNPKYWSYTRRGEFGAPPTSSQTHRLPYSQSEANFSMFFGLAIQMYLSTLVSDDSPFDRSAVDADGIPTELSESAIRGVDVFRDGHCALCHIGPNLTSSAIVTNNRLKAVAPQAFGNESFRISTSSVITHLASSGGLMFHDVGFGATGVTRIENDPGLASTDPFGNPLSFSEQYIQLLAGNDAGVVDPLFINSNDIRPCDMDFAIALDIEGPSPIFFTQADGIVPQKQGTENCFQPRGTFIPTAEAVLAELQKPDRRRMQSGDQASFKVPTLRNVELTGPFMHDGSMSTLEQLIIFYGRGGNFVVPPKEFAKVFEQGFSRDPQEIEDLINFLNSLTDDRVRYERAPFDHPQLFVSNGHAGDSQTITATSVIGDNLAKDDVLVIPAVGAGGLAEPLQPFEFYLEE